MVAEADQYCSSEDLQVPPGSTLKLLTRVPASQTFVFKISLVLKNCSEGSRGSCFIK